jgi:phage-related protein
MYIETDIMMMKKLLWLGDSYKVLCSFPAAVQRTAGFELRNVQRGEQPSDCKPMPSIGKGVEEIRVWAESGTYRVIYIARMHEAVYVLHVFQKKSQETSQRDLVLARERLEQLIRERK